MRCIHDTYLHFCLLTDFYWVQDNPGTVEVHLFNPLPLELKITNFVSAELCHNGFMHLCILCLFFKSAIASGNVVTPLFKFISAHIICVHVYVRLY